MMAIGYQLAETAIPDDIKEREYNARARNTLDENFFEGDWGKPISENF